VEKLIGRVFSSPAVAFNDVTKNVLNFFKGIMAGSGRYKTYNYMNWLWF
jgi:hypothetical protein